MTVYRLVVIQVKSITVSSWSSGAMIVIKTQSGEWDIGRD